MITSLKLSPSLRCKFRLFAASSTSMRRCGAIGRDRLFEPRSA
jgi:hypothetical protein